MVVFATVFVTCNSSNLGTIADVASRNISFYES